MMATPIRLFGLALLVMSLCGKDVTGDDYDLRIVSASRTVSHGPYFRNTVYAAEFTSSFRPDFEWYNGYEQWNPPVLANPTFTFANGRGRTSVTVDNHFGRQLRLKIGKANVQYYILTMDFDRDNFTETLNTVPTRVIPGLNVSYSSNQPFNVTFITPLAAADGFVRHRFLGYKAKGSYLAPDREVKTTFLVTRAREEFLQIEKQDSGGNTNFRLTFDPSDHVLNGAFDLVTMSVPDRDIWDYEGPILVTEIKEHVVFAVHPESDPGPFPSGFISVNSDPTNGLQFFPGADPYAFRCYAFANSIASVAIFKVEGDGTRRALPVQRDTYFQDEYYVEFRTKLASSPNPEGLYVCRVDTQDGDFQEVNSNFTIRTEY